MIFFFLGIWERLHNDNFNSLEFERVDKEAGRNGFIMTPKRELAKVNYHIHPDAIKENLIVPTLTKKQKSFVYADEADLLNVALFGKTATRTTY